MEKLTKDKEAFSSNSNKLEKFQNRLINLSVAVEDKTKSVDLFIEAIKSHQESSDHEFKQENARLRAKFNEIASKNSETLSALLENYEQSTKKKQEITSEIETLVERKRREDIITKASLMKARQQLKNEIEDASDEWKGCEGEREEIWIAEKVKHVRACTVDALQPEIKRLSVSQEVEMNKLLEESVAREHYTKKEVEIDFQREFSQYLDEAERRKTLLLEGRRKKWRNKIDQLEKSHAQRVEEMKEKATDGSKGSYPVTFNDLLDNNYINQINQMKDELQKRLKEMDQIKNQKFGDIIQLQKEKLEKIANSQLKQKEEWKHRKKLELHSHLEEDMSVIEKDIQKDRDVEIDTLIRSNYDLEEEFNRSLEERKKKEGESTDKNFTETMKHLNEKNNIMKANLERVSQEVDCLRIEHQNILDRIETKEQTISKTKKGILVLTQACERLESSEVSMNASIYEAIEEQNKQQLCLEKRLHELETAIHDIECDRRAQIEYLSSKHNERLEQIEFKVRKDIKMMDRTDEQLHADIKQSKIILESKRAMLLSVYSSSSNSNLGTVSLTKSRSQSKSERQNITSK